MEHIKEEIIEMANLELEKVKEMAAQLGGNCIYWLNGRYEKNNEQNRCCK